jgi:hypothetical protein
MNQGLTGGGAYPILLSVNAGIRFTFADNNAHITPLPALIDLI